MPRGGVVSKVAIASIRTDGGTQTRERIDAATVESYADAMQSGAKFPATVVFYDGATYWLADGFHRVAAAKSIGVEKLECEVQQGDKRAAILHSVGANSQHGFRRTNGDKRRAVVVLLSDDEWAAKSDRWIAERCGVSHTFVQSTRGQLASVASSRPRLGQDGKTRRQPNKAFAEAVRSGGGAANDLSDESDPTDEESELVEADAAPMVINPDRDGVHSWGELDVASLVVKIIGASREYRSHLQSLFDEADPRFRDEVVKRTEDTLLSTIEALMGHLPVDGKRADRNRARFQVLTGGK
jgi:ParB-like nuclease family protein